MMKPIKKLKEEISNFEEEIEVITENISENYFQFPTFKIESYNIEKKGIYYEYYRGRWYVDSKKKQMYLGSKKDVLIELQKKYPNITNPDRNLDKVKEVYINKLRMNYWKDEYEGKDD